ncbi:genetic suppressor element 1-like isoform X1 [Chiloscyllium plagiosum]|uniref:genetic suppressor element 1-like isoform X1 n=2 Tax=Chiloscyllium plagiosum TaxID=36176 RepID=UPI001CB7B3F8|nr:genetic suppressor element 1-like isoform X1 [Chiloscyllium plagiosum]
MASSYTAMYLQMKLRDPRRNLRRSSRDQQLSMEDCVPGRGKWVKKKYVPLVKGMSHEPKSSSLSMISATQRTTATVNPLTPSSLNGPAVTNGSHSSHGTPSARGVHTASFAAALRKLAKQAEDPRGSSRGNEHSPISSPVANHSSPTGTPKRAPGTIIIPQGTQTPANTPPVVTIAPTQTINGLWRADNRQSSDSTLRSRNHEHPLSTESLLKKDNVSVSTHLASSHPAFYLSGHSIQGSPYSTINLQRPVPHLVSSSSRSDDFLAGFRPYHGRDEIRSLSSLPSLGLDSATAAASAAYYHPAFLSHLPYQHPPYRIDDPYVLSLQAPFLHIPQPGTLAPLQPTDMHLSLTGMRQPLSLAQPSGLHPDHLSIITAGRLQMEDEVRQREKEREHEKEKDWERRTPQEREPDVITEQGRKREKQQIVDWEKEIKRRKEMKQEKDFEIEYGTEKNTISTGEAARKRLEGWKDFISAMEHIQPVQRNDEHISPWRIIPSTPPEKAKAPSLGSGKARTLPIEPIAVPASSSLLGVSSNISSHFSSSEGKCGLRHSPQQQGREERPGHGVDFRQHHLQQLQSEQGHQVSKQERDRSRTISEDENQDRPQQLRAPPPLISPHRSLRETSPLPRPFLSPHALQPAQALNYSTRINNDALKDPEKSLNDNLKNDAFKKITGEHFSPEFTKSCTGKDVSVIKKSGMPSLKTDTVPHLKGQTSSHQCTNDFNNDFKHQIANSHLEEIQKQCLDLSTTSGATDLSLKSRKSSPASSTSVLCSNYATANCTDNQELQLQQPIVSKLDLAEKKLKEARLNGQHSEHRCLDVTFCKGEIRNRIRRLAEQPPLKLDDTPRKMLFLGAVGLTTQSKKEEVKQQKMRKRRRMLRERSPSPLCSEKKQLSPLRPPQFCSISHSPEELNRAADFEEKKQFLALFNLKHLTAAQRKDIEETLLKLLSKSGKKSTPQLDLQLSDPPQCDKDPAAWSDAAGVTGVADVSCLSVLPADSNPNARSQENLPAQPQADQCRPTLTPEAAESVSKDRTGSVNENKSDKLGVPEPCSAPSGQGKPAGMLTDRNGKIKLLDEILQNYHGSVFQNSKSQASDQSKVGDQENAVHYSSPAQRSSLCDVPQQQVLESVDQNREVNQQPEELDSQDEMEQHLKWQGVTGVLQAYQEYIEEKNVERQVLQEQLNHLKERNHELNLTAEHLSAHMLELRMCKQRYEMERQHHQAALRNLRKCLDLTHCLPESSHR